ncbi:hypothetical protein NPIL_613791 [Nephila pilipes]|uniref:Uncharacterized protein n=1 Tax=Nephila pilipes TaxID=299642 RepID=A0A8X6UIN2_NEPPI|nr:hypothetical protein NPIL_613791 [Nephila pilipes]
MFKGIERICSIRRNWRRMRYVRNCRTDCENDWLQNKFCIMLFRAEERTKRKLKKRFSSTEKSNFSTMTSLLDPRFENLHFQDRALLVHGTESSAIKLEKRVNHRIVTVSSCLQLIFLSK